MKHHDLKIHPAAFAEVKAGRKLAELRLNDRDYQSGDTVMLYEYDRDEHQKAMEAGATRDQAEAVAYTGDACGPFTIGHILREGYGLPEGYVMFSLLRPSPLLPQEVEEALEIERQIFQRIVDKGECVRALCALARYIRSLPAPAPAEGLQSLGDLIEQTLGEQEELGSLSPQTVEHLQSWRSRLSALERAATTNNKGSSDER